MSAGRQVSLQSQKFKPPLNVAVQNINRLRKSEHVPQFELSLRAGCSRTQINPIENKEVNPTILLLNEIALALDTTVIELLKEN